ncbi:uncharacterized protein LOC127242189 [Andrographis paniculata]|uniref:uncharacterized protein LOC127242189 n=1 Tax=Andrographis paniculata TaxID=175694 RepID=UPI0021E94EFC|nr:uncharacterized protein LOC127242189 [Andrographis paniculata]
MDSGNSGSLQSSSGGGGDEEFDSHAADSFIITSHAGGLPISPPAFDPISSYMQFGGQNPNPLFLNPNVIWSGPGPVRSDPIPSGPHEFNHNLLQTGSPVFQPPATTIAADAPAALNPPRNPRKRSRASRRAPTTVLTTDANNFRAMVQEFTGIPAPPFASSSLPRNRFDLFGSRSAAAEPSFFRRPFPHKPQSPPAPPPFFNLPNPILNSLLQSTPKFFPPKPNLHDSFEVPPAGAKIDCLEDFCLSSGGHTGLPNLIPGDQIGAHKNPDHSATWKHNDDVVVNGGYSFPTGKSNVAASSSAEKAPENIGGREGMMESWICSSE